MKLNEGEKALFDWQYRLAGGFTTHLMEAISKADGENQERMSRAFPHHVEAYRRFASEIGYWESIKKQMGR